MRRSVAGGRVWRRALAIVCLASAAARSQAATPAQPSRLDVGRFTAVYFPSESTLANTLLAAAARADTFPGLPRPHQRVLLSLAPDFRQFRAWSGPGAPEWGAAVAFPQSRRIVMQGRSAGSDAGDPREVFRHELAHLALHEYLGDLPPRWFDEGYATYAAREWRRNDAISASLALALRGTPTLDELDDEFGAGTVAAQNAYALAYRAVVELASLDGHGDLSRFLGAWRRQRSMDMALRSSYGITLADFEQRWRQSTRRRYGALALAGDATIAGLILLVVVVPLYAARRQRDRQRLAAMVAADAAAERVAAQAAASQSALDILLGDGTSDGGAEPPPTHSA